MLDLQDVFASTRNQSLKGYQANSKAIRRRPPLLPFPTTNCSSSHSFSLPKQNKIKQCQPHNIHSYNVCHSKDVFVFSKKTPKPEPTIRSVARKMWNSQDKLDSHDEVFLPNPNLKGKTYRILPKTSHGRRRN